LANNCKEGGTAFCIRGPPATGNWLQRHRLGGTANRRLLVLVETGTLFCSRSGYCLNFFAPILAVFLVIIIMMLSLGYIESLDP